MTALSKDLPWVYHTGAFSEWHCANMYKDSDERGYEMTGNGDRSWGLGAGLVGVYINLFGDMDGCKGFAADGGSR